MSWKNDTYDREFILLGFSNQPVTQIILFTVFLIILLIILLGNSLIITVTLRDNSLQTPMYFFLTNLSFLDLCYSLSIVPRMLKDLLSTKKNISFTECVAQMYISLSLGITECILLAVMAYDRYIAICYPLHYTTKIHKSVCIKISTGTWICGFMLSIPHVALTWFIDFCGHKEIHHFFCEVPEILSLGCGNIIFIEFVIFIVGIIILIIPVLFIIISYIQIIKSILKIISSDGQQKAFSTCASHVLVVSLFYGSAMATYMKPRSTSSPDTDKMFALFYCIITPMLNPLIYTLRNKEVKKSLKMLRIKNIFLQT
ncbi:olfactory receptor 2B2-like [Rhinophrynus dorsalis]